jgi:hypothetical protein
MTERRGDAAASGMASRQGLVTVGLRKPHRREGAQYIAAGRTSSMGARCVGFVEREEFLASTGRGNRRWDGGQLAMTQDARDDRLLGNSSNKTERAAAAQGTSGHIQRKYTPQEPGPAPGRGPKRRLLPVHPPLARCRNDRVPKLAMRRQTPRIAHQMDARQGDERCQLLQEFQRRECDAGRAVGPRLGKGIHEVPVGILCKTLKRHGAFCRIPNQALQLVTPMRRNLGVGVQGKPVDTGAASIPAGAGSGIKMRC